MGFPQPKQNVEEFGQHKSTAVQLHDIDSVLKVGWCAENFSSNCWFVFPLFGGALLHELMCKGVCAYVWVCVAPTLYAIEWEDRVPTNNARIGNGKTGVRCEWRVTWFVVHIIPGSE